MKKTTTLVLILLGCICVTQALISWKDRDSIILYLVGDSTCATKRETARPETGWGEKIQQFFNEQVTVENHAAGGRSTKSFRAEGRWTKIMDKLKKNDWVFIQFGHNDEKVSDTTRGVTVEQYTANLKRYVEEAKSKGAHPVLLTPIVRRAFDKEGKLRETHVGYADAVRKIAAEMQVPLIDMEKKTAVLVSELGVEKSKELFLWATKEKYPNLTEDKEDNTHLNDAGATDVASLVIKGIREITVKPLQSHLK